MGTRLPARAADGVEVALGRDLRYALKVVPEGANTRALAVRSEGNVVYPELFKSTDLVVSASRQRVDMVYVLHDKAAPASYSWRLDHPSSLDDGQQEPTGSILFADKEGNDKLRFVAWVEDGSGKRIEVKLRMVGSRVDIDIDLSTLDFPATLFQVVEVPVWKQLVPAGKPSPRCDLGMAYEKTSTKTVLFGGHTSATGTGIGETWVWTGTTWTQLTTATVPLERYGHAMAGGASNMVVMQGGQKSLTPFADTCKLNPGATTPNWTCSTSTLGDPPGKRVWAAAAMNTGTEAKIQLTGGSVFVPVPGDVGEMVIDGGGFSIGSTGPWAATYNGIELEKHSMVFTGSRYLVFGGADTSSILSDTTYKSGLASGWTAVTTTAKPPARVSAGMAYDSVRSRAVLFGGAGNFTRTTYRNDTWEFDPATSTWAEITPATKPDPRWGHGMVYDTSRKRVLLFGGCISGGASQDTWVYQQAGIACSGPADCVSGFCKDGVCCNMACTGSCERCDHPDKVGTCIPVIGDSDGTDDADTCSGTKSCNSLGACKKKISQTCTLATECVTGFCQDGYCCDKACSLACDVCAQAKSATLTANGYCSTAMKGMDTTCTGSFACNGVTTGCPTSCSGSIYCNDDRYCDQTQKCIARKSQGASCVAPDDCYPADPDCASRVCSSGNCVDGYCCNAACSAPCDFCSNAKTGMANGTCSKASDGTAPSPAPCGNYLCDGNVISCPSNCFSAADCIIGSTCTNNTCVGLYNNGATCQSGSECKSGNCVDQVCCDTSCGASCDLCNKPDHLGFCTIADPAATPSPSCSGKLCDGAAATCPQYCTSDLGCMSGTYCNKDGQCVPQLNAGQACDLTNSCKELNCRQCTTGFCANGVCCLTACAGNCDTCSSTGDCSNASSGYPGSPTCAPYLCSGAGADCPSSCSSDSSCSSGNYCNGSTCISKKSNGADCFRDGECSSAHCVDGVCCNDACSGACDTCYLAESSKGSCQLASKGFAGDPPCTSTLCTGDKAICGTSCVADSDCVANHYCSAAGTCAPKKAQGQPCNPASECSGGTCGLCLSGNCTDGYCCDSACSGACDLCDAPGSEGTCTNASPGSPGEPPCTPSVCAGGSPVCPGSGCVNDGGCAAGYFCAAGGTCQPQNDNGTACSSASCNVPPCNDCKSGSCVDGYCCNSVCGGACDRCDLNAGTCTNVPDGTQPSTACGNFLCAGAATCPSTCASDADCTPGAYCNKSNQCATRKEQGQTCGGSSSDCLQLGCRECETNVCSDGYCCNSACDGNCDTCAATPGSCTLKADGTQGMPSCGAYLCDGTKNSCPAVCSSNLDCASSYHCTSGACQSNKNPGESCSAGTDCVSGHCVDGVCCNTACAGACDTCFKDDASKGTCSLAGKGSSGNPVCATTLCTGTDANCGSVCNADSDCVSTHYCSAAGTCLPRKEQGQTCSAATECKGGTCTLCKSGHCVDGFCCNSACSGSCDTCQTTPGTCSVRPDGADGQPGCGAYLCDGQQATCPGGCTANADCSTGFHCTAGGCQSNLSNGQACTNGTECTSGYCVDQVCCNSTCGGPCDTCNKDAATKGTCVSAIKGSPGNPACTTTLCPGDNASCGSTCANDSDCVATHYCSAEGSCLPRKTTGQPCDQLTECKGGSCRVCQTGFCVDKYCCDTACSGACDQCNQGGSLGTCKVAPNGFTGDPLCSPAICDGKSPACPGDSCSLDAHCAEGFYCAVGGTCQPKKLAGATCNLASDCNDGVPCGVCKSGNCADGYCCNTPCVGPCDVCNVNPGTCVNSPYGSAPTASCLNYVCSGAAPTCPPTCASDDDCAAGAYCNKNNQCVSRKAQGLSCGTSASDCLQPGCRECSSGNCADGFCCNSACSGNCDTCSATPGTCSVVSDGTTGMPSCGAYLCDGSLSACPSGCAANSDCANNFHCQGGTCQSNKPNGTSCNAGTDCTSGYCVEGYCCNSACSGPCDTCNKDDASKGTCLTAAKGSAGVPACAATLCTGDSPACGTTCNDSADCVASHYCSAAGSCLPRKANGQPCDPAAECKGGSCTLCQSGSCSDGYCCNTPCGGKCDSCSINPGTCQYVADGAQGNPSCGAYLCDGTFENCPSSCSSSADCEAGSFCNAGACQGKKAIGQPCLDSSECGQGPCVDGYCCNSACSGPCDVCAASLGAASNGTCAPASQGTVAPGCGGYLCSGTSTTCPASCAADSDCATGFFCAAGGTCAPAKALGDSCAPSDCAQGTCAQCASGQCVDGFCCDTQCGNKCDSCSQVPGTCLLLATGESGTPSCGAYVCDGVDATCPTGCTSDGQCAKDFYCNGTSCVAKKADGQACDAPEQCKNATCVDGYCCDTGCTDQCMACNVAGKTGTCSPKTGEPEGSRPKCTGAGGDCAGTCNGADPTCKYPGATTICGTTTCANDVFKPQRCDGQGKCVDAQTSNCAPYGCDSTAGQCRTKCSLDTDCSAGAKCDQVEGKCSMINTTCKDDFTVVDTSSGTETSCTPYKCSGGACRDTCSTSNDCASGYACSASHCVLKAGGDGGTETDGGAPADVPLAVNQEKGCGCRVVGASSDTSWAAWILGCLAVGAAATRRRQRRA